MARAAEHSTRVVAGRYQEQAEVLETAAGKSADSFYEHSKALEEAEKQADELTETERWLKTLQDDLTASVNAGTEAWKAHHDQLADTAKQMEELAGVQRELTFRVVEMAVAQGEATGEGFDFAAYLASGVERGMKSGLSREEAEKTVYGLYGMEAPSFGGGGQFQAERPGGAGLAILHDRETVRTPAQEAALRGNGGTSPTIVIHANYVIHAATAATGRETAEHTTTDLARKFRNRGRAG